MYVKADGVRGGEDRRSGLERSGVRELDSVLGSHGQVAFTNLMTRVGMGNQWLKMGQGEKERVVLLLLDQVEVWEREDMLRGARAILYLAQG